MHLQVHSVPNMAILDMALDCDSLAAQNAGHNVLPLQPMCLVLKAPEHPW